MSPVSPLAVREIDHVEFYVGNAKQAAAYYRLLFGFEQVGYAGPETGRRDRASYLLQQGQIRFVLTTPLTPDSPAAERIAKHGDGVHDIVLKVDDVEATFAEAVKRGARPIDLPHEDKDAIGHVRRAAIGTYGDTVHSLLDSRGYSGPLLPHFVPARESAGALEHLKAIDHMVGNVEEGRMDTWVDYYTNVFGFEHFLTFDDKDISTEFSALRSKVVTNANGRVKFPINEPAGGRGRSQIQEYLDFYCGPGVQHIALLTGDIVSAVGDLRARGVEFLEVPDSYYENLSDRVGPIHEDMDAIRKLKILIDRDDQGYLLQIFTKPVEDRPTLFFEIIQRRGSQSFGKGNFKALFEAIEREQARRGNL